MSDRSSRGQDGDTLRLFQSDDLAEYEYRRTGERRTFLEPEKRLMFAVLEDAILCFQRFMHASAKKEKRLYEDAAAWIFEHDDDRTFSFECICDICGMSPEFLRGGLRRWRARSRSQTLFRKPGRPMLRRGAQRSRLRY